MKILADIYAILAELQESGLVLHTAEGGQALYTLLGTKVEGRFCKCGEGPLMRFEVLNNRCERCRVAGVRRMEIARQKANEAQYAR